MKFMFTRILISAFVATGFAADFSGEGTNPFVESALDDATSLTFFTKPNDKTLYFRLSWKRSEKSSSSLSSGSGVQPGQPYVYYWDDSAKVFWFADQRFLQKIDLSDAKNNSTKTNTSATPGFKHQEGLPEKMRYLIESLLQKNKFNGTG